MKNADGEEVGTLIADIPEGAFLASSSDANIQMDVQADAGADGVLDRVQQQLETNGEAGYTLNNYVMADVTFYVNGEKQVPQQPITFTVKGTNLDSQKAVAFSDDRQNNPTFPDVTEVTTEDGSKALQFTADMDSETSVFGVTEALQDKEWSTQVGNATVKVTGTEDALPEGAQLTVSEITAENEKEAIENAVMEQENDDSAVTNIVAYDIKFMMNGQEVQPSSPVQVSVDSPQIVSDQDTSVYHVDENNSVEDMDGSVDADGNIVFDAPHFSTYVIVQKGENAVNVTIQHYDATKTTDTKIYADDVRRLPVGGKINDYTKADNWTVDHVVQVIDGTSKTLTNTDKIEVNKECTIKVYYTPKTTTVDGATTFYDYTVKVTTVEPFGALLNHLTHPTAAILNEKAVKESGDSYGQHPVGTGPYKFVSWQSGDKIVLEANPDYFLGVTPIKYAIFRPVSEASNRTIGIETGELDIAYDIEGLDREKLKTDNSIVFLEEPSFGIDYIGFNTKKAPFNNVKVRQAIALAINADDFIIAVYKGSGEKANSLIGPKVFGYTTDAKAWEYNVEKAKKLLAEAGYPNGFKTKIWVNENVERRDIAIILQAQLKEIGIDVAVETLEWGAYLDGTARGDHDMFMLGWVTVTGDADYGLFPLLHTSSFGGAGNRAFYSNPHVDELLSKARVSIDQDERKELYREVQIIAQEEVPYYVTAYKAQNAALQKNIENFKLKPAGHHRLYGVKFKEN